VRLGRRPAAARGKRLKPGEHLGVPLVALALGTGDGVELARVGDENRGAESCEVPADPRAVRVGLHRHGGSGKIGQQLGQRGPGVGPGAFMDHLAGSIQDADILCPITKIKADGEPVDEGSG